MEDNFIQEGNEFISDLQNFAEEHNLTIDEVCINFAQQRDIQPCGCHMLIVKDYPLLEDYLREK